MHSIRLEHSPSQEGKYGDTISGKFSSWETAVFLSHLYAEKIFILLEQDRQAMLSRDKYFLVSGYSFWSYRLRAFLSKLSRLPILWNGIADIPLRDAIVYSFCKNIIEQGYVSGFLPEDILYLLFSPYTTVISEVIPEDNPWEYTLKLDQHQMNCSLLQFSTISQKTQAHFSYMTESLLRRAKWVEENRDMENSTL